MNAYFFKRRGGSILGCMTNGLTAIYLTSIVLLNQGTSFAAEPIDWIDSPPVLAVMEKPEVKYPNARLSGMFQADAGWIHQDAGNITAVGDIQDGADFRRARLAAVGDVAENIGYNVEFDFALPGRPNFMDVWVELRDVKGGNIRIGQFRQPIGMDGLTSVKELAFLERGLPFVLLPFRQIGVMYQTQAANERATWAISGFRYPVDSFGGNVGDNGGFGTATRLTGLVIDHGKRGVLHLGGGYSFVDPASNNLQFRSQPEFFVSETGGAAIVPAGVPTVLPPFVNTGIIAANNFHLFNAELGVSRGPWCVQSEIFYAVVNPIGGPQLSFPGAYAQASCMLTGESRAYDRKAGVFGGIDPIQPFGRCGMGAWEVAVRYSYLNLNNAAIQGGELSDVTFGLSWHLTSNAKLQFNYIHAFLNSSSAATGPNVLNSNADIVAMRAHVDF